MKKYFFPLLLSILFFVVATEAKAMTFPYQPVYTGTSHNTNQAEWAIYNVGSGSATISSFSIVTDSVTSTPDISIQSGIYTSGLDINSADHTYCTTTQTYSGCTKYFGVISTSSLGGGLYLWTFGTSTPALIDEGAMKVTAYRPDGGIGNRIALYGTYPTTTAQYVAGTNEGGCCSAINLDPYIVFNGYVPPSHTGNVAFVYPVATSSAFTDFTNWVVNATTSPTGTTYYFQVSYHSDLSSTTYYDYASVIPNNGNFRWTIPKTQSLWNYSNGVATTTWYAQVQMGYDPSFQSFFANDAITFYVSPATSTIPLILPYSNLAGPFSTYQQTIVQGVASSTYYCTAPSNIVDIGGGISYGLCSVGTYFFGAQQGSLTFLSSQWNSFRTIFPFNIVFNFASTTAGALASASTSASQDIYFTLPSPFSIHVPLITSTTLEQAVGSTTKATIFTTEKALLWLGGGIRILFFII